MPDRRQPVFGIHFMKSRFPLAFLILLSTFIVSGCSDSESENTSRGSGGGLLDQPEPLVQPTNDFSDVVRVENDLPELEAIAGLWNNSNTEEGGVIDVYYLEITSEGLWNNFNYRGDSVDQGENCYDLFPGRVISLGSTNYQVSTPLGSFEVSAVVTDGRLVVTNNTSSVTLPAVTGISAMDFNEC